MDPKLKLSSPLTKNTTILSFDVESNGFHGPTFAVGAVLMRLDETVIDEFSGRAPIEEKIDPWVEEHVLPVIKDLPEDHKNQKSLRNSFWRWYLKAKERADYVVVNNGYPSEARFLIACQDDDLKARYNQHPFPLLELGSLLLQVGVKPLALKRLFVEEKLKDYDNQQHHPRYDAWVAALATVKALKLSRQLKG